MTRWLAHPWAETTLRIVGAIVVSLLALWLAGRVRKILGFLGDKAERALDQRAKRLGRGLEHVSEHAVDTMVETVAALLRVVLLAILFYAWLVVVTYDLDASHHYVNLILDPLRTSASRGVKAFADFLPNVVVLVLIVAFGRVLQSVVRAFTQSIALGRAATLGLDASVATPTHRILSFVLWVSMIVLAAPYLPGAESKAFQAVSVMLGILLSLGSSSLVSNLIAGLTLTYARAFRVGDRVRIGDHYGDVVALGPVTTRLRTIKDEELILPNSFAHGTPITNYSRFAQTTGVQAHAQVTIGYDTPYTVVEALLVRAALATPGIAAEPLPYVLQPALEDYYVRYEICAYTRLPNELHLTEANLNRKILDTFFAAGVEICSPAFTSIRDGNAIGMPREAVRAALETLEGDRQGALVDATERQFRVSSGQRAKS